MTNSEALDWGAQHGPLFRRFAALLVRRKRETCESPGFPIKICVLNVIGPNLWSDKLCKNAEWDLEVPTPSGVHRSSVISVWFIPSGNGAFQRDDLQNDDISCFVAVLASHGDHILGGWTTVLGISRWPHPTIAKVSYGFRRLIDVEQRVCCLVQERSWIYPIRQTTFVGSYSVSVVGFGSNVLRSSVIFKKENRNTNKSTQKHPVYMYICIYIVIMSYTYILIWRDTWHFMRTFLFKSLHLLPPTPQNGERGTSGSVWKLTRGCGMWWVDVTDSIFYLSIFSPGWLYIHVHVYFIYIICMYIHISMMAIMMVEHDSIAIWWLLYEYG